MIEFGETLRKAREAKGLSAGDIAKTTHIMVQMVEALEREDFSRIVAPIYGRGFVKLYCEAVGLDPKPLVAEFMEIYNGNRPAVIRMAEPEPRQEAKSEAAAPEPASASAAPEPAPAAEPPAAAPELAAAAEPAAAKEESPSFALEQENGPIRMARAFPDYRADVPDDSPRGFSIPAPIWRILVLVVAAAAILWLLIAGAKALYKVTMTPPEAVDAPKTAAAPEKKPADAKPPRKQMDIPPLYID